MIRTFGLTRIADRVTPAMQAWLSSTTTFTEIDTYQIGHILSNAINYLPGWNEEDLKMRYLSFILDLGQITAGEGFTSMFEKTLAATVQGIPLKVKSDFTVATGIMNLLEIPYFHLQEYKPQTNPSGEAMAQLLQAMLIVQTMNNNGKPVYGAEIIGQYWKFILLDGKEYCLSRAYDSLDRADLEQIIAILRGMRVLILRDIQEAATKATGAAIA